MNRKQRKIQLELAFAKRERGEASDPRPEGTERNMARSEADAPAAFGPETMEEVCNRENLKKAYQRVRSNKGSPGIDGVTVEEFTDYLKEHGPAIREQLLLGTYQPQPVKRVEIPKPDGGKRKLGIPCVVDRWIQQAMLQVLQGKWDRTFSKHSYGFRPGRNAHQAVAQAQTYISEGYGWVVDLDLEKFFDRVQHDRLMARLAKRIEDKRVLKLIRAFLNAGVMENGLVSPTQEGTPQGGPLSPWLSNVVLDELDKELERRGHRFCRYADDCNIYVRSERAGRRVMQSVTRFIAKKLKLKVNQQKSEVARPQARRFLGFSFTGGTTPKRRIAPTSLTRFKNRIRSLTRRNRGVSGQHMICELTSYLKGWIGYFGFCQTPSVLDHLNSWIRRRIRMFAWKRWKVGRNRFKQLQRLGIPSELAAQTVGSAHGPWRISLSPALHMAFPTSFFRSVGLPSLDCRTGVTL